MLVYATSSTNVLMMSFQDIIRKLQGYWIKKGCLLWHPTGLEVGAGTLNPATFFKVLGEKPWKVVYLEPSRRPTDGRYGKNPLRTYLHYQLQVILKPSPLNSQEFYLDSLGALGIDWKRHDLRFVEDNWSAPTLGAWGIGWEVWLDGLEITQFTYLQQTGGIDLNPVSLEITYGLERIAAYIQKKSSIYQLNWKEGVSYESLRRREEEEFSKYSFELADTKFCLYLFSAYEKDGIRLLEKKLLFPAYESVLRLSHLFNILDARGAIGQTERIRLIERVRKLAKGCAQLYLNC